MINTDTLQITESRKKRISKACGLVRPETVILLSKDSLFNSQGSLPNTHYQTACRFSVLFASTSGKN
jgi:hypothetical protein